jgi:hypothetical protein
MRKLFLLLLVLSAVNLPAISAQQTSENPVPNQAAAARDKQENAGTSQGQRFELPAEIKLILEVEDLPGIENAKSFWEGFYEIRVVDWKAVVEKTKSGGTQGIGEVLLQLSFPRRTFLEKENRHLKISVPVAGSLLERLQQQTHNPQAFLLRSTVHLFDGQLKRNYAFQIDRVWDLKLFPDGEATIAITIEPDGSYSTWGPIPKALPPGYTTIGLPPDKIPPTKKP